MTLGGTDYGEVKILLETKVSQILNQLKSGKAILVFDQEPETCNVLKRDDHI